MITAKVQLTQPLKAERQFVATTGSEHHMLFDDAAGGTSPKPIELVAVGLAGFTAFGVITILRHKYHQGVAGYDVRVEADQAERALCKSLRRSASTLSSQASKSTPQPLRKPSGFPRRNIALSARW
jgi:uncharacterized OsmC-like protein